MLTLGIQHMVAHIVKRWKKRNGEGEKKKKKKKKPIWQEVDIIFSLGEKFIFQSP